MNSSRGNRCLVCGAETTIRVGNDNPICGKHIYGLQEYRDDVRACQLTEFTGEGRNNLNMDIFNYCTRFKLHEFWGPEYLKHALQQHSHHFAGRVEIKRLDELVRKYFNGIPDDNQRSHCLNIADRVPHANTRDRLLDIALACLAKEAQETGNGCDIIAHSSSVSFSDEIGNGSADLFFVFSFEATENGRRVHVHSNFLFSSEASENGYTVTLTVHRSFRINFVTTGSRFKVNVYIL